MNLSVKKYGQLIGVKDTFKKLSIVSGKSIHELERVTFDELKELKKEAKPLIDETAPSTPCDYIFANDVSFYPKPLNTMTLAEFIDGYFMAINKDVVGIVVLLYRIKLKSDEIGRDEWEDWGGFTHKRRELFEDIDWFEVKKHVEDFYRFKDKILKEYYENHEEEDLYNGLSEEEKKIVQEEERKEEVKNQYMWEQMIYQLSNGDVTKFNQILDMNVVLIFNLVNMKKTLNI